MRPQPTEEEIMFILDAIAEYLTVKVRRSDVQSAWSGIRPLAVDPKAADTASALRDHVVVAESSGLITITGTQQGHVKRDCGPCRRSCPRILDVFLCRWTCVESWSAFRWGMAGGPGFTEL
jgi:hypothetical protein